MTPDEAAAILTYVNQLDPLIPINDANADLWWEALKNQDVRQAMWCVKDYYANVGANTNGPRTPLTPPTLRYRIGTTRNTVEAGRRALKPPEPSEHPAVTFKRRDPERWQELVNQGRRDRADRLARQGIDPTPRDFTPPQLERWSQITGHTPTR